MNVHVFPVADLLNARKLWAVYDISATIAGDVPEIIYIGTEKLGEVFDFHRPQQNSDFIELTKDRVLPAMVRIIKVTHDEHEANREAFRLIKQLNPRCNVRGYNMQGTKGRPLVCSNGKLYGSQVEAAKALGLSQGALSRHLKGELNHVKNYKFAYATPSDLERLGNLEHGS